MKSKLFVIILLVLTLVFVRKAGNIFAADGSEGPIVTKVIPWSGWWWPRQKCELAKGTGLFGWGDSALEKYDKAAKKLTGKEYHATEWELQNHYGGEGWYGHCNGWSAASILEKEPKAEKTFRGIDFSIADQKGLLTESYMVTKYNFFGTRYDGPNNNYDDIDPGLFHYILLTYVKGKGQPVILDIEPGVPVWNYPLYAYKMEWTQQGKNTYIIKVKVWLANDNVEPGYVGTQYINKTYEYKLLLDDNDRIKSGEWIGRSKKDHPDFIWIPYENVPPNQQWNDENPWVDYNLLKQILKL